MTSSQKPGGDSAGLQTILSGEISGSDQLESPAAKGALDTRPLRAADTLTVVDVSAVAAASQPATLETQFEVPQLGSADSVSAATLLSQVPSSESPGDTILRARPELEDYVETLNDGGSQGGNRQTGARGRVIGDYEVLKELGRGGMGVVYKARHRILKRTVALKMILAGSHSSGPALQRFLAEARAVAHLQHPGIVQIFDMGQHEGLPWFSLEFVDGADLHRSLDGKPRDARSSAALVEQVCRAMQYAHDNNILHRDLKPANILLDSAGNPKVTDFGLAKEVDSEDSAATRDGTIMGSPSYMPPEQARGQISAVSPKSDQYSMGAVLYQMLTARPPFITDRPLETVMQVINNEPVAPRQLQPSIPVDLETICLKALQKDPDQRYESCEAMADDLRRYLNGEPILARPISRLRRAWRWCRRNPKIAAPSALAALFICLTAIIASWAWATTAAQAQQIATEKMNVETQRDEAERQKVVANQQRALAEEKEALARKQAALALQNIQFVLTETDSRLKQQPGMNELRIAILRAVSKKWDELDVELTGGIRGEAIPTLMALRQQIGTALFEMDQLAEADREFAELYDMSAERIALKGRTDAARTNRAKIAIARAPIARRLGQEPEAAVNLLREAVSLIRECISDPRPNPQSPSTNEINELLAAALQNLGVEYLQQGNLQETEVCFVESLTLMAAVLESIRSAPDFEELSQDQKDTRTATRQIAHDKAAVGLAYLKMRLGKTEESITLYDKAIAGRREIYERRKSMLPLKQELAGYLGNYGQSLMWIGELEKAAPLIQESVNLFEELHAADTEKVAYTRQLTTALYRMGSLRDLQSHGSEADSLFERSRLLRQELAESSPDEENRTNLMLAAARCRQSDQARKLIDELGAAEKKNGELHLERARALAQLAKYAADDAKPELVQLALTALERAVEEGYADPFRVRVEPDLVGLKSEPRYIAVLEKLQAQKR